MKINYQRQEWLDRQKAKTNERMLRVVTDFNGGIPAKEIAKREDVTLGWIYRLLDRAKTEIIN